MSKSELGQTPGRLDNWSGRQGMETAGVSVQTAEGQREWAALRILSAGLEGTLSDGGGCEDAGGGQLEADLRADYNLVVSLLPEVQAGVFYFGHLSVWDLKKTTKTKPKNLKSVARV